MIWSLAGCAPYAVPEGATAYDYAPEERLTTFPDDLQLRDGRVAFTEGARAGFEGQVPAGWTIVSALESLDGFGTTAAVAMRFTGPIDADAERVRFVRLDDGQDVPFRLRTTDSGSTLLIEPLFPLDPGTGYAVAVVELLDDAGEPVYRSADLDLALRGEFPAVADSYTTLMERLDLRRDSISAATVFHTQTIGPEEDAADALFAANPATLSWTGCEDRVAVRRCELTLAAVDVMGTDEILDADVAVQRIYDIPVSAWIPLHPADGQRGPFPVVVYGHGLGEDRNEAERFAENLADLGIAVVAIDAPGHGQHPVTGQGEGLLTILQFFGVSFEDDGVAFVVERLRDHWRQATFDKLQLIAALREAGDLDGDGISDVDPVRIGYSGHSLGGIMGSELLARDPAIVAGELSVPGGRVSEIVQYGGSFAPLVDLMRPDTATDGDADRFFPIVQTAIERGDAANFGLAASDRDLLVQMVVDDATIPNRTTECLARALRVDVGGEAPVSIEGLDVIALPAQGNRGQTTAVLVELPWMLDGDDWVTATHGGIHDDEVGIAQYRAFWATAFDGPAQVIDPY